MSPVRPFRFLPLLLTGLLLGGCATRVMVDYEEGVDFSAFEHFAVDSREMRNARKDVLLSPIVDRRIERAIGGTLESKGLVPAPGKPDLRATFYTVTRTRTEVSDWSVTVPHFRHHPHYAYGARHWIDIDQYEEGTFVIDLVDARTDRLVWRGATSKRLGWTAPTQDEVDAIVTRILADFPPESSPRD